jgi:hypothetical protein
MNIKGLEASLKLDKKKAEQAMEKAIYENVSGIVSSMVAEANNGSYQHASYLLDRAFGKAKQSLDIESQGQPIVFMPASLVAKFALDKPIEAPPNVYSTEE